MAISDHRRRLARRLFAVIGALVVVVALSALALFAVYLWALVEVFVFALEIWSRSA